ncbi:MAG TPA: glutamine amidotransferase [Rhodanobacteraceae bacterium]|nr:glutamine amidotransferase [Rhodanobacteraceae bacterium]
MLPLLILLTGHAPSAIRARHGDFDHWFRCAMKLPSSAVRVVDASSGAPLPAPNTVVGAVISGSAAMVTERAPWSEAAAGWIRKAMDADLPLFGVCYGHQLMTHALGGRVGYLPEREIGTKEVVRLAATPVGGLPARFRAHTTHRQSVLELAPGSQPLAASQQDPHQVIQYGPYAQSTQFHPEFSRDIMRAYVRLRAPQLREEGLNIGALLRTSAATPLARQLLRRFAQRAVARHT